jgi:hypothetical protein
MRTTPIAALLALLALLVVLLLPALAAACPLCATDTAAEVRAGLADDATVRTVAAVASPFIVVAGVVAAVHFGFGRPRKSE